MRRLVVAGLGEIGVPVLEYYAQRLGLVVGAEWEVVGHDSSRQARDRAQSSVAGPWQVDKLDLRVSTFLEGGDVYSLCLPTGRGIKTEMSAMFEYVESIATDAAVRGSRVLVLVDSTVPVGFCSKWSDFDSIEVVSFPHRYWPDDADNYGVEQDRVIGAVTQTGLQLALAFLSDVGFPIDKLHVAPDADYAEAAKLIENAHRFVQIAFAESTAVWADKLGLSYDHIRRLASTKWNVDLLRALYGIGGKCLPKDVAYVLSLGDHSVIEAARVADWEYKEWLKG